MRDSSVPIHGDDPVLLRSFLASQFADAGPLDELLVTVVPVVLGGGKPVFDRRLPLDSLQLTGVRTFENGMVELGYSIRR